MTDKILYIGLHGLAGSGKDTIAKMMNLLLNDGDKFKNFNDFKKCWETHLKDNFKNLATFNQFKFDNYSNKCICIAFADQLKNICSAIYGVPVDRFYYNKGNGWICINKEFQYTEEEPPQDHIITADDLYSEYHLYMSECYENYYISLREILIYVGTYVIQRFISPETFVNIVQNNIINSYKNNNKLKYVIITDVRFWHEFLFVRSHNGVLINIKRDNIKQMENIAEHKLDDVEDDEYDIVIDNSYSYDELLKNVWNLCQNGYELSNETYQCGDSDNYLRRLSKNTYLLCVDAIETFKPNIVRKTYLSVTPSGGPEITLGEKIPGTNFIPQKITLLNDNYEFSRFVIHV